MLILRMPRAAVLAAMGLGMAASGAAPRAAAADLEWTNASGGLLVFNTSTNWTPGQTPTAADNLLFQIDQGGAPILMNSGALSLDLTVADNLWVLSGVTGGDLTTSGVGLIDDATATGFANGAQLQILDGMTWTLDNPLNTTTDDNNLLVGDLGYGSLLVSGGSNVAAEQFRVGNQLGGVGEVTVTGAGSTLNALRQSNAGLYIIGLDGGTGTVNVLDGGQLVSDDTTDNDIHVGRGFFDDGTNPVVRSTGALNVDGVGSLVQTGDLYVGYLGGDGTLNITGGAQVLLRDGSSPDFSLGRDTGSTGSATISGAGSLLEARHVILGEAGAFATGGTSTMAVENGGRLQTIINSTYVDTDGFEGDLSIGFETGSDATLAVYGTDGVSTAIVNAAADIKVGDFGRGELRIGQDLAGNTVGTGIVNARTLFVGDQLSNTLDNKVIIDGANAELNLTGSLNIADGGVGSVEVIDGILNTASSIFVGANVDGVGTFTATDADLNSDLDFVVGRSTGSMGVANISGGTLDVQNINLGIGVNSTGTLTVDDGTVVNANTLFFGNSGGTTNSPAFGSMEVRGGSAVNLGQTSGTVVTLGDDIGTTGILTVTGDGSEVNSAGTAEWWVGGSSNDTAGTGVLNVLDNATITAGGRLVVGYDNNTGDANSSDGTINIDNATVFANADLTLVGFTGLGELNITNGAVFEGNGLFIADNTGAVDSSVLVDGAGSIVNLDGRLMVGDSVRGNMTVSNGAQVNVALDAGTLVDNRRLIIGDEGAADGASLTVTGTGSRIDYHDTERISVGFNGGSTGNRALLDISDGGVVSAIQRNPDQSIASSGFVMVGDESGGNGQINVTGAGSLLEARYLNLGDATSNSSGVVNVTNGGEIFLTDFSEVGANGIGDNVMTVEGIDTANGNVHSRFETAGDLSIGAGVSGTRVDGQLIIRDGGQVVTGDQGFIGRSSADVGRVDVGDVAGVDALATWDIASDLFMSGNTNVTAANGSQNAGSSELNISATGRVTVGGTLYLKDRGTINLNGGELIADDLVFLDFSGTSYDDVSPTVNWNAGSLRYTGASGKTFNTSTLNTLFGGEPYLLDNSKKLAVDGLLILSEEIRVDGGELSFGNITTSNFQNIDFDSGTLNLTNASLVVTAAGLFGSVAVVDEDETVNVAASTFVQSDGLLNVVGGSFSSGATTNSGTIVISQGTADFGSLNNTNGDLVLVDAITTGTLTGGDLTIVNTNAASALSLTDSSSIAFGIETAAGAGDLLQVENSASLDGSLIVSAADVSSVALGDEFDLILADSITGTFASTLLPTLSAGLGFDVLYEANRVALAVISTVLLAGDYNGNGIVDAADYTVWQDNFGSMVALAADGNGNGVVDAADYTIWQDNFGNTIGAASSTSTIPEPGTAGLVIAGAAWGLGRRRRAV